MPHSTSFPPRAKAPSIPQGLSRLIKEDALRGALRQAPLARTGPEPVSYPLGLAMGIFAAHVGYLAGSLLGLGLPGLAVNLLTTTLVVAGLLALLRKRDRWVLGLSGAGALAGLVSAPLALGPIIVDLLQKVGIALELLPRI